jgi:hypothetical protein
MVRKQLIPAFGDHARTALTGEDVNAWLRAREGTLRMKTLRDRLALLHKLFEDAREAGYPGVNRLSQSRALRRPRAFHAANEREIEVLTPAEVNQLLDALPPTGPALLHCGLHGNPSGRAPGPPVGRCRGDGHRIHVRRTVYRGGFYMPKTKRSRRAIDVGD